MWHGPNVAVRWVPCVVPQDDECALAAVMQSTIERVKSGDRLPSLSAGDHDQLGLAFLCS